MNPDEEQSDTGAAANDAKAPHEADRAPTPEEERMADHAAEDADPQVAEHASEMARLGANVKGEGAIVPDDGDH